MPSGKLYTYPDNFRAFKALIAAKYSGFDLKCDSNFKFGETDQQPDFRKKFPFPKVPAFEGPEGVTLIESNAIAHYVANDELRGGNDKGQQAEVIQWMSFADSEIVPAACTWVFPVMGIMAYNKQNTEKAKETIQNALKFLNQHLLPRTFLVGERLTLADITVACSVMSLYEYVLDPSFRAPYQNVNRWFTTVINQSKIKEVVGEFALCTKMGEFDAKKFAEFQTKTGSSEEAACGKKDKKGKKEKEQKPKEEKPKAAPKKEEEPQEEMDESEMALAEEPKAKDPFASMPKGTFDMDDFKRFYSNEDESKSVPYFWEKFDKENYSIWFGEYKYPTELTLVFMSCNLITGMFQRLDKMRKNAFASVCLFGSDNDSTISGVWVWRGHDLAFPLSPDWSVDYESYEWKKLDSNSEATKALLKQYLCWEGTDKDGRKFNQGKIFK